MTIIMKRKKYSQLLILFTFVFCSQTIKADERKKTLVAIQTNDSTKVKKDSLQWLTPKQFTPLSFIKAFTMPTGEKITSINVTTMLNDFPLNWVKSSDLDSLVTLIGSTTKCNCFLSPLSSYVPAEEIADVGGYAIIFINSFRQKNRIDFGLYNCPKTNKESAEEIIKWREEVKPTK